MKNKSAILFAFKRVVAALLDVSMFLIITMFSVLLIAEPIIEKTTDIIQIREEYTKLAENYNVRIWNEEMGMYIDNPDVTEEELNAFNNDERVLALEEENSSIVMLEVMISLSVAAVIVYLVIPLMSKNNQTLGKKAMGLIVVSSKKGDLKKVNVAIRGVSFVIIELFIGLISYGIVPLISLALIMFSNKKQSLHDFISSTKVIKGSAGKEDIVNEEDDEYYTMIAKENARDLTVGGKKND